MSKRWLSALISLSVASLLFTACKKNFSSDNPLPASYYPSVIISSDNNVVYAINPGTGARNWQYALPNDSNNTGIPTPLKPSPLVYNEMVYLATFNTDTIYKLNSKTGVLYAKMTVSGHNTVSFPGHFFTVIATPIADANILYIATTNDTIYALDTGTSATKWKFGSPDNTPLISSPVIYNGNIYIASTGGHVYCLNKTTGPDAAGNPIWQYPGVDSTVTGGFYSSPSISAPYLYIGSMTDSNMYCIYLDPPTVPGVLPNPGILRWTFKTGGAILSSPTVYAGKCIFGSNDFYVYCVDTQTAAFDWKQRTNSQVNSSPIINNQVVYIGSYDYNLYALNIIDGHVKWKFASNGLLKSSPVPYNGLVYIGSYDNYLYAVDSSFGTLKWKYYINGNIQCSPAIDDLSGSDQINSAVSGYNTSGTNN